MLTPCSSLICGIVSLPPLHSFPDAPSIVFFADKSCTTLVVLKERKRGSKSTRVHNFRQKPKTAQKSHNSHSTPSPSLRIQNNELRHRKQTKTRNCHDAPSLLSGFLGSLPADRPGHLDSDMAGGLQPLNNAFRTC